MQLSQAVAMDKYIRFLWKYFFVSALLSVIFMCVQDASFSLLRQEFRAGNLTPYLVTAILLIAILMLVPSKISAAQRQLWLHLCSTFPGLRALRRVFQFILFAGLIFASFENTCIASRYGGIDCAYLVSSFQNMELAERIFQVTNGSGERSFAIESGIGYRPLSGQSEFAFESQNIALDTVVESVYGAQSRNLANRYLCHAYRAQGAFENYVLSSKYFKKALGLYQIHADSEKCLDVLQFLTYAQGASGEFDELQEDLKTGLKLLSQANFSASAQSNFSLTVFYADWFGIDVSRENLLLCSLRRPSSTNIEVPKGIAESILFLSLILSVPITRIGKGFLLQIARRKWLLALKRSNSSLDCVAQLEKLMLLELAHGNLSKADEYSRQSLAMATAWKI